MTGIYVNYAITLLIVDRIHVITVSNDKNCSFAEKSSGSDDQGSNNGMAKLVSVRSGHDDYAMAAVPDNNSPAGYGVKLGPWFTSLTTQVYYKVYMAAKAQDESDFRTFYNGSTVCNLISNNTRFTYETDEPFLPRQIVSTIFTGFNNECKAQGGTSSDSYTSPMIEETAIKAVKDGGSYELPSSPFDLMVNIHTYDDEGQEVTSYIFQVNFTVEYHFDEPTGSQGNTGYYCLHTHWNYWIIYRICKVYEFVESIFGLRT